jgi:hypothetical protein
MTPLGAPTRSNRTAVVTLILTLVAAGLEIWGIRASLAILLR